jgi:uncharacterized protein YukE
VSGLAMPGGDPAVLEQLAGRLEAAAAGAAGLGTSTRQVTSSIRSSANWTGDAADAYTEFTRNLGQGAAAAEVPLSRIAAAVRSYAGCLRTAQQKVAAYASAAEAAQVSGNDSGYVSAAEAAGREASAAVSEWQAAGNHAAAEVSSATGKLAGIFGSGGPVQSWIDRQLTPEDLLAGMPATGDQVGPQILKTPPGEFGPEILKTPPGDLGPEILGTPIGDLGPEILITPPGDFGPQILKTPPGLQGPLINYDDDGSVPGFDGTGKVHGELPDYVPRDWTPEDLEQLQSDLTKSIQRRQNEQIDKGEDPSHRTRINQELRLLRQIEKRLSGS